MKYPVTFDEFEGEGPYKFADEVELGNTVEYLNDWSYDYVCHDALGRRFRLVVEDLTMLFCAEVPEDWSATELEIRQSNQAYFEVCAGSPHRGLSLSGHVLTNDELPYFYGGGGSHAAPLSLENFDTQWTKACLSARRLNQAYRQS